MKNSYWSKRRRAFYYAFRGISLFFKEGAHAKLMGLAAILAILTGLFLGLNHLEWVLLTLCCGLVFASEALNSALEYLTDLASPRYHPLAQKAKDVAAGAVLILSFAALVTGLLLFLPKILALLA